MGEPGGLGGCGKTPSAESAARAARDASAASDSSSHDAGAHAMPVGRVLICPVRHEASASTMVRRRSVSAREAACEVQGAALSELVGTAQIRPTPNAAVAAAG